MFFWHGSHHPNSHKPISFVSHLPCSVFLPSCKWPNITRVLDVKLMISVDADSPKAIFNGSSSTPSQHFRATSQQFVWMQLYLHGKKSSANHGCHIHWCAHNHIYIYIQKRVKYKYLWLLILISQTTRGSNKQSNWDDSHIDLRSCSFTGFPW